MVVRVTRFKLLVEFVGKLLRIFLLRYHMHCRLLVRTETVCLRLNRIDARLSLVQTCLMAARYAVCVWLY